MYKYITNPKTGRKVSIYGKLGQSIIQNYITQTGGKCCGTGCTKYRKTKNPKCNDQSGCNWVVGSNCPSEVEQPIELFSKQTVPLEDLIKHFRIYLVDNNPEKNKQLVKAIFFDFNNSVKHFPEHDPEGNIEEIINKQIKLNQVDWDNIDGFSQGHLVEYLSIEYYVYCAIQRHNIKLVDNQSKNIDLLFSIFYTWYRNRHTGELNDEDLDEDLPEIIFKEVADHSIEDKEYHPEEEAKLIKYIKSQY